jgi:hypothetical protein
MSAIPSTYEDEADMPNNPADLLTHTARFDTTDCATGRCRSVGLTDAPR